MPTGAVPLVRAGEFKIAATKRVGDPQKFRLNNVLQAWGRGVSRPGVYAHSAANPRQKARQAACSWDAAQLLATAEADIIDYLVATYSVERPVLHPELCVHPPVSEVIQGRVTIVTAVPFDGDREILDLCLSRPFFGRPATASSISGSCSSIRKTNSSNATPRFSLSPLGGVPDGVSTNNYYHFADLCARGTKCSRRGFLMVYAFSHLRDPTWATQGPPIWSSELLSASTDETCGSGVPHAVMGGSVREMVAYVGLLEVQLIHSVCSPLRPKFPKLRLRSHSSPEVDPLDDPAVRLA